MGGPQEERGDDFPLVGDGKSSPLFSGGGGHFWSHFSRKILAHPEAEHRIPFFRYGLHRGRNKFKISLHVLFLTRYSIKYLSFQNFLIYVHMILLQSGVLLRL